jgi:integrase
LASKKKDGARDLYLKDLKNRLTRFEIEFGEKKVAEVQPVQIDDWLRGLEVAPQTRNNFRTVLRTVFEYAVDRTFAPDNPVERTAKVQVERPLPAVFSPKQMLTLLEKAPSDLIPWLAIGGFSGLRSVEIERLDWSEVDLAERLIRVSAEKSKTRKRRVVAITDNLAAWLAPLAQKAGFVADFERVRVARDQTTQAAGMKEWPHNALRHSFASYHLAHHQDAPKTAFQLGHTSPKMLYQHYNGVVSPKDAAQWWRIIPPTSLANVVAFSPSRAS